MSAKPAESATATEPPKAKGKGKLMLVLGLVGGIVLAGGGAGGVWFYMNKKGHPAGEEPAAAVEPERAASTYLALENLICNLADAGGERVVQIGMTLELQDEKSAAQVKALMPVVRSKMLMLVTQRTADELLKRDGKEKLANDVVVEVSRVLGFEVEPPRSKGADDEAPTRKKKSAGPVRGVLFSSFIVQ